MNKPIFTTTGRFGRHGRRGVLHTRRGDVQTPTFMPDGTRGAVKGLSPDQVASTGVQIVLANTYHLHLQPGEQTVAALGDIHQFSRWQGPILTDSGGFQVFSLSHTRKITEEGVTFKDPISGSNYQLTPEKSMQIQFDLGSDMIVAFDDLSGLSEAERYRIPEAFARTHRWLERSIAEFKRLTKGLPDDKRPLLFGVVQGGLDLELRRQSLQIIQDSAVDAVAIGGLSVGETKSDMYQVLEALAPLYDPARPRFLLGVGDPPDLRAAVDNGIDMLDCVLPTRNARHATVWIGDDQKIHLTNEKFITDQGPIEPGCDCTTCQSGYSRGFLRHQFKVHEPLAGSLASIHNLRYLSRICESYRQ